MSLILLSLTLLFPFLYKYSYVTTNQYSLFPIINSFIDPNYLRGDWYVSANQEFGPRTIFAWYMANISKIIGLPQTFFLHYLLYIFFLVFATYKLSFFLIKNKYVALLTTISVLFSSSITLGGNILVTQDLTTPQLPLSMTLMAIYFLFRDRFLHASILFAIASYLHPLIGLESATIFFLIFGLNTYKQQKLKVQVVRGIIYFVILTLPLLYLYLSSYQLVSSEALGESINRINILAHMRNPHHFVASSFTFFQYFNFFVFLSILLFILYRSKNLFESKIQKITKLLITFILIFSFLGFLGTEVFYSYPLTLLQPFRLTLYIFWLGAIIIFSFAFYYHKWLLLLPLFYSKLTSLPRFGKVETVAFLLGITLLILYHKLPKKLFVILLLIYFSLFQYHQKFNFNNLYPFKTEEVILSEWINSNTRPDSLFLIPPNMEGFRLIAQRAIVVDWKAFPFQEDAMYEWAKRICEIGNITSCDFKSVTLEKVMKGYKELDPDYIFLLSEKYGFRYFISDKYYPEFKYIYNNLYSVYEVDR